MNTWNEFEKEAQLVERTTKKQEPEIVNLLQDSLEQFANAFSVANSRDASEDNLVKMSLLSYSFGTLKCSIDLTLRGYYVQSLNLLRIVDENWISYHYLTKNPDKAQLWLCPSKEKQAPKYTRMLRELDNDFKHLKGKIKEWYSILSSFAHTNAINLLPQISMAIVPTETTIHYGTSYKRDLFRASCYAICLWIGIMLSTISEWVPKANQWHSEFNEIEERIKNFIDQENVALEQLLR